MKNKLLPFKFMLVSGIVIALVLGQTGSAFLAATPNMQSQQTLAANANSSNENTVAQEGTVSNEETTDTPSIQDPEDSDNDNTNSDNNDSNNTVVIPEGGVLNADGSITLKDGSILMPDGTILVPSDGPDATTEDDTPATPEDDVPATPEDDVAANPENDNLATPEDEAIPEEEITSDAPEATPQPESQDTPVTKPSNNVLTTAPSFTDTSLERYSKYLMYRNEIHSKLKLQIEELTKSYESRVRLLASLLSKTEEPCKLFRMTNLYTDKEGNKVDKDYEDATSSLVAKEINSIDISNWGDILAVFVAQSSLSVENPLDLMNLRELSWDNFQDIFDDMNTVTYTEENGEIHIYLQSYTYEDMASKYEMDAQQKGMLEELMQPEFQSVFANLTGNSFFNSMTAAQIESLKAALPKELNVEQEGIVSTALSLVGKVSYFWGGKYPHVGFNPSWGIPQNVSAEGSESTGSSRPYGLDCSGYVAWVFVNATKNPAIASVIGESTTEQWSNSVSLGWDEAKPGDLVFPKAPGNGINHVGVVVSVKSDGSYLVAHCSSSYNSVVVTDAWSSGFRYVRRPYVLVNAQQNASGSSDTSETTTP